MNFVQGRHALGELLHIFDASRSFHVGDGGDLLGLALMPRWLMMKPSSFPEGTPKRTCLG
jgi:hypothetical protein